MASRDHFHVAQDRKKQHAKHLEGSYPESLTWEHALMVYLFISLFLEQRVIYENLAKHTFSSSQKFITCHRIFSMIFVIVADEFYTTTELFLKNKKTNKNKQKSCFYCYSDSKTFYKLYNLLIFRFLLFLLLLLLYGQ